LEETLRQIADVISLGLEALALLAIVLGAVQAVVSMVRVMVMRQADGHEKRLAWIEFSRWLIAGLTFQLAADIVRTMVVPDWNDVGRVAAIAVIRTFLTHFLDRDIEAVRERDVAGKARHVEPS
jgi:uncharacterized membrane protein